MKSFKALSFVVLFLLLQLSGKAQNCMLNCPSNIVVKADKGQEGATVSFSPISFTGECGVVTYTPASGSFFRLGSHSIIATSASGQKCSFTVNVTDNESPELSVLTLSTKKLWPASNKLKKVGVFYTASDNGQHVTTDLSVTSNATDGIRDWELIDNHQVRLKASRLPDGTPRIYTIGVTAIDEAGNKTTRRTSIAVSKTMTAGVGK